MPSDGYFLSDTADAVYYTLAEQDDDFAWYRFDLASGAVTTVKDVKGGRARADAPLRSPDHLAFDFERRALAGRNDAGVGWSWVRNGEMDRWLVLARWLDPSADRCTVFALHGDELKPILRTRKSAGGYSPTRDCGVRLDESYFLPGGRQVLLKVDTPQHQGYMVVDTQDGRYGPAPTGLEVYFPVPAWNVKGVALGRTGPQLEKHAGPYHTWPARSRLFHEGTDTGRRLDGYLVEAQFALDGGFLVVTSHDCPYEEMTHFYLLDRAFGVRGHLSRGALYTSWLLKAIAPETSGGFRVEFHRQGAWRLAIRERAWWRRLSLTREAPG